MRQQRRGTFPSPVALSSASFAGPTDLQADDTDRHAELASDSTAATVCDSAATCVAA